MAVEKERVELLILKTSMSQQASSASFESLLKAMSELKLREGETKTLKKNLDEKQYHIVSLNEVIENKDTNISKVEANRKEVKSKGSKENTKLIGEDPLCGDNDIIWDYLSIEITKFREYLNLIEDEHDLALSSNHICRNLKEELPHRPIEEK